MLFYVMVCVMFIMPWQLVIYLLAKILRTDSVCVFFPLLGSTGAAAGAGAAAQSAAGVGVEIARRRGVAAETGGARAARTSGAPAAESGPAVTVDAEAPSTCELSL